MNVFLKFFCCCLLSVVSFGQDTLRLAEKPKVILHSWYPEYKEFPDLKIGETKVLFTIIPLLEETSFAQRDIDLRPDTKELSIVETEKTNQYLVKLEATKARFISFEVWYDLGNSVVLIRQNSEWVNIRDLLPVKGNRVMLDRVKLKVLKR